MELTPFQFEFIARLVYEHSRIHLGANKIQLVAARLGKRLRALKLNSFGEYCQLLKSPNAEPELTHLVDVISTNHTQFFREKRHFDFLREVALPEWTRQQNSKTPRRLELWSAACASGEEPYTLAIVLSEFFRDRPPWDWKVHATDISRTVLDKARRGIYAEERLQYLSGDLARRYFQRGVGEWAGHYRVKESLRRRVVFQPMNLFQCPYPFPDPFPIIFCRNVMIYFDHPTQQNLVAKLENQLSPGGYLMVGHSESLTGIHHSLAAVKPATYQKPNRHTT